MTLPVSVVMPSLFDPDMLARHLPVLHQEFLRRAAGDELVLVDDTGSGQLAPFAAEVCPWARLVVNPRNLGFAGAARAGALAAGHGLLFLMNPDIRVRPGFLEPLIAALGDPKVHSAVPRILLHGEAERIESVMEIDQREELHFVRQRGLEGQARSFEQGEFPVAYGVGGALLLRRDDFLAQGFDPLYEPFYHEDTDLGLCAWRRGLSVRYVAAALVEHHHRSTIKKRIPSEFVRAVIERNLFLLQWKFLDHPAEQQRHLEVLYRYALDAYQRDQRDELTWLLLALDRLEALARSRAALPPAVRDFHQVRTFARPFPPPSAD
jgi:GT2 family glycosyltransferase